MNDIANFLEFLESRKTIRNFLDEPVDEQTLLQVLEAARWSPSAQNSQPWEFVLVKDKDLIQQMSGLANHASTLGKAPQILAFVKTMKNEEEWLASQLAYEQSVSCAGMITLLALHELGLGGYWINVDRRKCADLLGVPQEVGDVAFVIAFGCVDMDHESRVFFETPEEQRRKNIISSVYLNKYGQKLFQ